MATTITAAAAALKTLRGERPAHLRVIRDDDSAIQIAVPNVKRWKGKTAQILDSMPWLSFEPVNSKGDITGPRIDNAETSQEVAGELEELELDLDQEGTGTNYVVLATNLLGLFLKAQDVALVRQRQAYDSVLDNNQKLLTTITARLSSMEQHAHKSFLQMQSLHERLLTSGGEDGAEQEILGAVAAKLFEGKLGGASQGGGAQ